MLKLVLQILATLCLIGGLLLVWTPIPVGAIMIAVGFTTLIGTSRRFARLVRSARKRLGFFNSWIMFLENRVSGKIGRILKTTRPRETSASSSANQPARP